MPYVHAGQKQMKNILIIISRRYAEIESIMSSPIKSFRDDEIYNQYFVDHKLEFHDMVDHYKKYTRQ